ncbi:hypothetical protein RN96_04720 [Fusobacterium polymorphum]|uniref:Uncharacterized protein n=1 Tax=Fusobacterium nucleatum subsp. polymorphum TaxID=76857 RepID=A0A2B7YL38_FUSNP|nr:hypothetical protein [Fusobacterium polymorphum]PGH21779.1 hypothetical protein RN96_00675 [Fusobacterium polymorphum]PGH22444.1 hypothetical protein RN96_04720 [Fusobacterium polymorphum]
MNIDEYNSKNMGKQILVLKGDEIKTLNHFASIAKAGNLKGLIVARKYVGFTDTYRLATVKDLHEELQGSDTVHIYDVLDELKKAGSLAVLRDGKLAIQIGTEVTEYEPINGIKVPDISEIIENLEYESHSEAKAVNKITDDLVWKMLKITDSSINRYCAFKNHKLVVTAYPNEQSRISIEVLELESSKVDLVTNLNVKFVDSWLKFIKNERFDLSLGTTYSAVKFSVENVTYIVMPIRMDSSWEEKLKNE